MLVVNTGLAGVRLGLKGVFPTENGKDTEPEPWPDDICSVLFTKKALTAHVSPIISAPHLYYAGGIANFFLGLSALIPTNNETY